MRKRANVIDVTAEPGPYTLSRNIACLSLIVQPTQMYGPLYGTLQVTLLLMILICDAPDILIHHSPSFETFFEFLFNCGKIF